jgi:hypothetical protein
VGSAAAAPILVTARGTSTWSRGHPAPVDQPETDLADHKSDDGPR